METITPRLACSLQKCIADLWKMEGLCDVTVIVENSSFRCHRVILAACSGFFQGLFRSQMKECLENSVNLGGMTASTFNVILNSLYKGIDGLTEDNVLDVWAATVQLQIEHLVEECENFVFEHMSVDNCFTSLYCAEMLSSNLVVDKSLNFIIKHFDQVRQKEEILELSFDNLHTIIGSGYLAVDSEDEVVKVVMKWVEHTPQLLHRSNLCCDNDDCSNNEGRADIIEMSLLSEFDLINDHLDVTSLKTGINDKQPCQVSQIMSESQGQADHDQSELLVAQGSLTGSSYNNGNTIEDTASNVTLPGEKIFNKRCEGVFIRKEERNQYLFQLISACRLYLVNSRYLENLLKNNKQILSSRESHNLVVDALMYQCSVECRHDAWPEAAVHRLSSSMKHVMVFLSNRKFMAYSLNDGTIIELTNLPDDFQQNRSVTVYDNKLYLDYTNKSNIRKLSILIKKNKWSHVTKATTQSDASTPFLQNNFMFHQLNIPGQIDTRTQNILLAHGCYIYRIYSNHVQGNVPNQKELQRCHCTLDHKRTWSLCCKLEKGDLIFRFQQYILIFYAENNVVTAKCYNTETERTHTARTTMEGTTRDMTSFYHQGDVFILQRDGSLWKIVSSETEPVDFQLTSKLWDQFSNLRGCVVFRKQLFVIYLEDPWVKPVSCMTELSGLFKSFVYVRVKCESPCLPMVLSE